MTVEDAEGQGRHHRVAQRVLLEMVGQDQRQLAAPHRIEDLGLEEAHGDQRLRLVAAHLGSDIVAGGHRPIGTCRSTWKTTAAG